MVWLTVCVLALLVLACWFSPPPGPDAAPV